MSDIFLEKSKEIANDFLQSIVFIDDKAFVNEKRNDHEFNAQQISEVFAKSGKICAVYKPETLIQIDELMLLSKKSDITVIDWQIILATGQEDNTSENDDDDVEDPRGQYTRKIIKGMLSDPISGNGSLKLVLIYTGETILPTITDIIYDDLVDLGIGTVEKGICSITANNVKILIIAKPSAKGEGTDESKFNHNPELKEKIISYENLPDFILTEFTRMTNGLLTNFALKSLSEIRKNSSKLLSLFSKELDPAYLSHLSLIPNKEDANELLVELIKDAFGNLLRYGNVNNFLNNEFIESWLQDNIQEKDKPILKADGSKTNKNYTRDLQFLKAILNVSKGTNKEMIEVYRELMNDKNVSSYLGNNNVTFFSDLTTKELKEINKAFAVLSHHKSLYSPIPYIPILTLGTVVNSKKGGYYVCIQQRCDSLRVMDKEERRFLFIPLNEIEDGKPFHFVTPSGVNLKVDNKSYSLRTIRFNGDTDGLVKAEEIDAKFYFKQKYQDKDDETFEWIFDLKDLHAQRIITNYTAQLSRIGLDETEWLRRSSN